MHEINGSCIHHQCIQRQSRHTVHSQTQPLECDHIQQCTLSLPFHTRCPHNPTHFFDINKTMAALAPVSYQMKWRLLIRVLNQLTLVSTLRMSIQPVHKMINDYTY